MDHVAPAGSDPFLTVVVRTQGTRPSRLLETLTCLAAQTIIDDVEIVIVIHDRGPAVLADVEQAVGDFEPAFRERVTVTEATGGSRGRPLNVGLDLARGAYVAFVDDDDVRTADWAEAFRTAAATAPPGRVLRSLSMHRHVAVTPEADVLTDYVALGPVTPTDAVSYDPIEHLARNATQISSYAIPTREVREHGIRASEELSVGEDYALMLDAGLTLGVVDTGRRTAIYQQCRVSGSRATVSEEEWAAAHDAIRARLDARPLTVPPGSASRLADDFLRLEVARAGLDEAICRAEIAEAELRKVYRSESWRLTAPMRRAVDLVARRRRSAPARSAPPRTGWSRASREQFRFDEDALLALGAARHAEFEVALPFRHVVIDGLVPDHVLSEVVAEFPSPDAPGWRRFDNARERKLGGTTDLELGPGTEALIAQLNGAPFLGFLERLTRIEGLLPDPSLWGGGLHQIVPGGYLEVHTDFNRHERLRLDRRLNLIVYLNDGWQPSWGGALELWDANATRSVRSIDPVLGRCVVFETTDHAPHGHPDPVRCPPGMTRKSLALYYYSNGRPSSEVRGTHDSVFHRRVGE